MKEIENGKISHAVGLEELILLKFPCHPKQSTDLMKSLSKCPWYFSLKNNPKIHIESQKTSNYWSNLEEKKKRTWKSQTSDYTTKSQQSKHTHIPSRQETIYMFTKRHWFTPSWYVQTGECYAAFKTRPMAADRRRCLGHVTLKKNKTAVLFA